jgi:DNA-binding NarL/FixJ family response regulator
MIETRIVIADDHALLRQGLRQVIEADTRLKVVAEADKRLNTRKPSGLT